MSASTRTEKQKWGCEEAGTKEKTVTPLEVCLLALSHASCLPVAALVGTH